VDFIATLVRVRSRRLAAVVVISATAVAVGVGLVIVADDDQAAPPTATVKQGWDGVIPRFEPGPWSPIPDPDTPPGSVVPNPRPDVLSPFILIPPATGVPIVR